MYIVYTITNALKSVITTVNFWHSVHKWKCFFKILWAVLGVHVNAVLYTYALNKNVCVQGKMFIQEYWVFENFGIVIPVINKFVSVYTTYQNKLNCDQLELQNLSKY